jgi:NAD+ diphosphatase
MRCSHDSCRQSAFPRIDPAIIVLVADGERALLGRQASWPPGRYSTIAGFVEPGESLEDAVAREVSEETSVRVTDVRYHSSQPWPFPSSLMLGFRARALTHDVRCPDGELEDARFFTINEIGSGAVLLPPATSRSFRLIEDWYTSLTGLPLRAGEPLTAR